MDRKQDDPEPIPDHLDTDPRGDRGGVRMDLPSVEGQPLDLIEPRRWRLVTDEVVTSARVEQERRKVVPQPGQRSGPRSPIACHTSSSRAQSATVGLSVSWAPGSVGVAQLDVASSGVGPIQAVTDSRIRNDARAAGVDTLMGAGNGVVVG